MYFAAVSNKNGRTRYHSGRRRKRKKIRNRNRNKQIECEVCLRKLRSDTLKRHMLKHRELNT